MGRPRIYDTPHFCLHTYVRKGHTYVEAYRNEWDPEKKRSRIAQRKYVGVLDTTTGRVRLGKKYLSENDAKELSVILVKVAVLANMIILLQRPYSHEIFVEFLKVCAGTLGVCFIATILFYVVGK